MNQLAQISLMSYRENLRLLDDFLMRFTSRFRRGGSRLSSNSNSILRIDSLLRWLKICSPLQICSPFPSILKLRKRSEDPSIESFHALETDIDLRREGASAKEKSLRKRSGETRSKRLFFSLAAEASTSLARSS